MKIPYLSFKLCAAPYSAELDLITCIQSAIKAIESRGEDLSWQSIHAEVTTHIDIKISVDECMRVGPAYMAKPKTNRKTLIPYRVLLTQPQTPRSEHKRKGSDLTSRAKKPKLNNTPLTPDQKTIFWAQLLYNKNTFQSTYFSLIQGRLILSQGKSDSYYQKEYLGLRAMDDVAKRQYAAQLNFHLMAEHYNTLQAGYTAGGFLSKNPPFSDQDIQKVFWDAVYENISPK